MVVRAFRHILAVLVFARCAASPHRHRRDFPAFVSTSAKAAEPFEMVIVHPRTGDLYVGAVNSIFQLTANLQLVNATETGPKTDNVNCSPDWQPCGDHTRKPEDNHAKVLLLADDDQRLIFCGSTYQGMCVIMDAVNLSRNQFSVGDEHNIVNYVAGRGSVVAFFAKGLQDPTLYTAVSYDGRPLAYMPHEVSSRTLLRNGPRYLWEYTVDSTADEDVSITAVSFRDDVKRDYVVGYVYGFSHGNFSYFVTTQRMGLDSTEYETRLARVHHLDSKYFSYSEIPLACQHNGDKTKSFNYATAAFLGPATPRVFAGNQLVDVLGDPDALYGAFARTYPGTQAIDDTKGSAVCAFAMTQVVSAFTVATKQCFGSDNEIPTLPWIAGSNNKYCRSATRTIDDNFAGSGLNKYIEGRDPIRGSFQGVVEPGHLNDVVTSLAVTLQNEKPVAVVGTQKGVVTKLLLRHGGFHVLVSHVIADDDAPDSLRAVARSNAFDANRTNVYFLTGRKVVKVPISSCRLYPTCAECSRTMDPLNCGWCGSYCAYKDECNASATFKKNSCPPVIHDFYPKSGPLTGGTTLTIVGEYFSASQAGGRAQLNVYIGLEDCNVTSWEMTKIKCVTKSVTTARQNVVKVQVADSTKLHESYEISGTAVLYGQTFGYVEPKALRFTPSYGPFSGGTNVTIYGQNLDAGSSRTIWVAGIICTEYSVAPDKLQCTTGLATGINHTSSVITGVVTIEMDRLQIRIVDDADQERTFTYRQDPVITDVRPKQSILSGGRNVTVTGRHLNSVATAQMVVEGNVPPKLEMVTRYSECHINSATAMTCPSPSFTGISYKPDPKAPLITHLSFVMDGVASLRELPESNPLISKFLYYPDPRYHAFGGEARVKVLAYDEHVLTVEGENLDLAHGLSDVRVLISNDSSCVVQDLTSTALLCRLPSALLESASSGERLAVQVIAGSLTFDIGFIQVTDPHEVQTGLIIALAVVIPLLALASAFVLVCVLRRWRRKKPTASELMVHYRTAQQDDAASSGGSRVRENGVTGSNDYLHVHGKTARKPTLAVNGRVDDETRRLLEAEHILIAPEYLEIGEIIGQGHFGCVYQGLLKLPGKEIDTQVAVKSISNKEHMDEYDVAAFLNEGLMMKDFHHINVLTLVGVCLHDDGMPMVIIPFMKHGDLLSFVRSEDNHPTVKDLLYFGIQISEGMEYLSGQKFVHRDLAARNCMLDEDLTVKVADFGLSRDVYESAYYSSENKKTKLPVKWMALESLEKGQYSTKSDVWSFGVVVWELITRGVCPYPDVDNWDIVRYLKSGRRMPQPSYCPDMLYQVMLHCWFEDSRQRPSFGELVTEVRGIVSRLEQSGRQRKVGLDTTYVNHPLPFPDEETALCEGAEAILV